MYYSRSRSQSQNAQFSGTLANSVRSSRTRCLNCSSLRSSSAKPTSAKSEGSSFFFARLYKVGSNLRFVRSPVAPKMTIVHGSPGLPCTVTARSCCSCSTCVSAGIAIVLQSNPIRRATECEASPAGYSVRMPPHIAPFQAGTHPATHAFPLGWFQQLDPLQPYRSTHSDTAPKSRRSSKPPRIHKQAIDRPASPNLRAHETARHTPHNERIASYPLHRAEPAPFDVSRREAGTAHPQSQSSRSHFRCTAPALNESRRDDGYAPGTQENRENVQNAP